MKKNKKHKNIAYLQNKFVYVDIYSRSPDPPVFSGKFPVKKKIFFVTCGYTLYLCPRMCACDVYVLRMMYVYVCRSRLLISSPRICKLRRK